MHMLFDFVRVNFFNENNSFMFSLCLHVCNNMALTPSVLSIQKSRLLLHESLNYPLLNQFLLHKIRIVLQ